MHDPVPYWVEGEGPMRIAEVLNAVDELGYIVEKVMIQQKKLDAFPLIQGVRRTVRVYLLKAEG